MKSISHLFLQKSTPVEPEDVRLAFEKKLDQFDLEDIRIEDVEVDLEGEITVIFTNGDDEEMAVIFFVDPDDGAVALIADDEDEEEWFVVDLDSLNPSITKTPLGDYFNLSDLSWLNKSSLMAILDAGDLGHDDDEEEKEQRNRTNPDPYGYMGYVYDESLYSDDDEIEEIVEGRKVTVVRGGKRVRLAVVRKKRRRVLTGKQKNSIRKAVRKRKMKKSQTNRKRKKSLKLRKRLSLRTPKLNRFQKTSGTANRKR